MKFFSIAILFHCLDIVPSSLLKKNKKFKFIAFCNIIVQSSCGMIAILAAFCGFGAMSLLIQPVFGGAILFFIFFKQSNLSLSLKPNIYSIKKIFSYSLYQFLFSFINYFSRNLDKLVVGKSFGVVELGYYEKSYRLMMLPVGNLSHVITPAIQPIFSEYQNNKEWLFSKSMQLFRFLTLIGFPLTVFLFFSSRELVLTIFGSQWEGAIPVFQILSLSVGFQIIYSPQGAFFQSANAVKLMFYCGIVTALLNIIAVWLGCILFHSITILAWSIDIAYTLAFFMVYFVMVKYVFHQKFVRFLKILIEPLLLTSMVAGALLIENHFIAIENIILSLFLKSLIFATIMIVYEAKFKTFRTHLRKKQ